MEVGTDLSFPNATYKQQFFFQMHALQSLVVTSLDFLWVFPQFNAKPGINSFLNFCIYCVPTEKKKKKCATAETTCFYETPPVVEMMHSRMIQGTQEADQNISAHMQSFLSRMSYSAFAQHYLFMKFPPSPHIMSVLHCL